MNQRYNRETFLEAFEAEPVSEDVRARRRLAAALRRLADKSIRLEADTDAIDRLAENLEALHDRIADCPQRPAKPISKRLFLGEADTRDVFDIFDYDPATGWANPHSPVIEFLGYGERVQARVTCGPQFQGPPDRVHGGVICAIFDGLLSRIQQVRAANGVTGTLTTRFLSGTPINTPLELEGWVEAHEGRKTFLKAQMRADGELTAEAEGIWISTRPR